MSRLFTTLTFIAIFAAHGANALVHKSGVINVVDLEAQTLTVDNKEYRIDEKTRVFINGEEHALTALSPDQTVTLGLPEAPKAKTIKGEIIQLDTASGIALVQTKGKDSPIRVRFAEDAKIGGKISSISELAAGQSVKLTLSAEL